MFLENFKDALQTRMICNYHGNHKGMETLFQIDKNTFICRKRTNYNPQEKELTNSQEKELVDQN